MGNGASGDTGRAVPPYAITSEDTGRGSDLVMTLDLLKVARIALASMRKMLPVWEWRRIVDILMHLTDFVDCVDI